MASLKALTLASVAVVALTRVAFAADLLPPPPMMEPPPPMSGPDLGGWYLRGDVGVSQNATTPKLENTPDPIALGGYNAGVNQSFNNTSLSTSTDFDVGVGYQANPWLRGDVTLEYRGGGHFQSLYALNNPGFTNNGSYKDNSQYLDFYRADTSSLIGLVNAYADLGTWYGVTPFVGGGVGFSRNTISGMTDQGTVTNGNTGFTGSSGGYFSDGSKTDFAWALMTGLDFNVSQNLKLELGYRYLNYGKISSGGSNCAVPGSAGGFGNGGCNGNVQNYVRSTNTLASNDFRIGLRWMIGEAPSAPPPPEMPLVRKY
jgi:opacity protein-like surface antigen